MKKCSSKTWSRCEATEDPDAVENAEVEVLLSSVCSEGMPLYSLYKDSPEC